jgi:hypothetical protein
MTSPSFRRAGRPDSRKEDGGWRTAYVDEHARGGNHLMGGRQYIHTIYIYIYICIYFVCMYVYYYDEPTLAPSLLIVTSVHLSLPTPVVVEPKVEPGVPQSG